PKRKPTASCCGFCAGRNSKERDSCLSSRVRARGPIRARTACSSARYRFGSRSRNCGAMWPGWSRPMCAMAEPARSMSACVGRGTSNDAMGGRNMRRLVLGIAIAAAISGMPAAQAQTFPSRPVTIVVPFPAGGPTDALARVISERMKASLGQPVIIENVTGAAGTIGVGRVVRAAPDGYTLGIGHWQTHVVNGATYSLSYDLVKDFEPVALVADCPMWIVARAALSVKDLRELIVWLKENPGRATVGIAGVGGGADVVGTYFQKNT